MRKLLMLPLLLPVLAAPVANAMPAPAKVVVSDASDDAYWERKDDKLARPQAVDAVDIVRLAATVKNDKLVVKVKLADVRKVKGASTHDLLISLDSKNFPDYNLLSTTMGESYVLTHLGSREEMRLCKGAKATWATTTDTVTLQVPLKCVGKLNSYRLTAYTELYTPNLYAEDESPKTAKLAVN